MELPQCSVFRNLGVCLPVVLIALGIVSSQGISDPIVETPVGKIRGKTDNTTVPDKMIYKFLGIPYAKPPVGNLRFSKPSAVESFPREETFNATEYGSPCVQPGTTGDEDCLFLNIFAPSEPTSDSPVPVMVWIHGGAFQFDTAANYEGTVLAGVGQVIVVTANYRLGVLGFLNVKEGGKPSNFGLWDQNMALKWVQENIRAFGGDPLNVTLMGESAGAASVAYHALSPHSKGMFHKVILQSGTATAPWAQNRQPRQNAIDFIQLLGCRGAAGQDDMDATFTCLRTKNSSQILEKSQQIEKGDVAHSMINFIWVPSVDGDFITKRPNLMMTDPAYLASVGFFDLDLLLGMNNDEGSLVYLLSNFVQIVGANKTVNPESGISRDFFENKFVPAILRQKFENDTEETNLAMKYMYEFGDKISSDDNRTILSFPEWFQAYADTSFLSPITQHALSHSSGSNGERGRTYLYLFDFRPSYETNPRITGVTHGGDVPYVFGFVPSMKASMLNYTKEEGNFAQQVIKYWTNFARSGNPNLPDDTVPTTWPVYDPEQQSFIKLSPSMSSASMGNGLYSKRAEFWLKFLPAIMSSGKSESVLPDKSVDPDKTEPVKLTSVGQTETSTVVIALAAAVGVLGVVLVILILVIVCKRFRRKSDYSMS